MNRQINKNIEKEEIERNIDKLRDVLNESCATIQETKELKKRLTLSRQMDELIVQYMKINNE